MGEEVLGAGLMFGELEENPQVRTEIIAVITKIINITILLFLALSIIFEHKKSLTN